MSTSDFEIEARLCARRLQVKVAPEAEVEADPTVRVEKRRSGTNLPEELVPGREYEELDIHREVRGSMQK